MSSQISFLPSSSSNIEFLDENHYVTSIGCNIAIASLNNPTKFDFIQGHSQVISTFCLDSQKKLCASGQIGNESHKEPSTPVIVWDLSNRTQKLILRGHKSKIAHLAFSQDSRILAVSDDISKCIWIWDIQEEDLGCFLPTSSPPSSLIFGCKTGSQWDLLASVGNSIVEYTIKFDPRTFEYKYESRPYQNPTNGYRRTYDSCSFSSPYLFVGTHSGEVAIYDTNSATLRSNIQIDNYPISCMASIPCGMIVCGRHTSLLTGCDKNWTVTKNIDFGSAISHVSVFGDKALIRLEDTSLILLSLNNFSRSVLFEGTHFSPLSIAASDLALIVALGENGCLMVNIESDSLSVQSYHPEIKAVSVASPPNEKGDEYLAGCNDGTLACLNSNGDVIWKTEHLHRGSITAICVTRDFIATGGQDGMIRLITHKTRSLVGETLVHSSPITQVIPDINHPEWVHSVGSDRTVTTTDLSTSKRICQQATSGRIFFTAITQIPDGENELLVAMGDGKIKGFDWPRQGAILETEWPCKLQINSIAFKPKTRLLAVGGENEAIGLYNFKTSEWVMTEEIHSQPIKSIVWTPNGRFLFSASNDGICMWAIH